MRFIIKTLFIVLFFISNSIKAHEGMWIPSLLKALEGDMQSMGLKLTAEDIYSINKSSLKDAIVHFGGGCTAEVVSKEGLILTNHHCGYGQIQQHSSPENNLLKNGFWAMKKSEELKNPGLTATFIVRIEDVTSAVEKGVLKSMTEIEKQKVISNNIKSITEDAVKETNYSADIKPFYYGNEYYMIVSKTYNDVRLVGAPPSSMGKFGGDTDNWVWPRHTCDFSVFRIYADKNNEPAEISDDNQPYEIPNPLSIALNGVQENDFTMVFGFPGRTSQYLTSKAVDNYINIINPVRIEMRKNSLKHIDAAMDLSEETFIKYAAKQSRISNAYKKWIGQDLGLRKKDAIAKKINLEDKWLKKNKLNGELLEEIFILEEQKIQYDQSFSLFKELWYYGPEVIRFSYGFNKILNGDFEKELADKKTSISGYFKNYIQKIDQNIFSSLLPIYIKNMNNDLTSSYLIDLIDKYNGNYEEMAADLYKNSVFSSEEKISDLLKGNEKSIKKKISNDPFYLLSSNFINHYRNNVHNEFIRLSDLTDLKMKEYVKSLMNSFPEKTFWADANSTLRLTYGKVEGTFPRDGIKYTWFTTMDGIIEKNNTGNDDFKIPERLKDLHKEKNYGKYGNNGNLNICFLGSNHTTGGNSGSPALNAEGLLVGINFDRSWESTMSDVLFDEDICRNIMVDIRYVLWVIDIYAGAGHLVEEMNLVDN
tara:strand:+ start:8451 stop:10568 length:2118 start_codon:yes stop_codon:yes gene_type:complete